MNRLVHFVVLAPVLTVYSPAFSEDIPDEEIARKVVLSCMFEDDWKLARSVFDNAFAATESDRDRFARILCEVAHTNDARIAAGMVSRLMSYGTPAQLPFLYSQTTNANHGVWAVKAILAIEGVTSNSVAMVDSYLSMTNMTNRNRYYVCSYFIGKAFSSSVSAAMQLSSEQVYLRFMAESNIYHDWLDSELRTRDSSYAQSKRRLDVLRSVCDRTNDPADLNFVTNAINELVAYPEADLPD